MPRKEIPVIISYLVYQRFKKFLIIQLFVVLSPALLDQITSCTHTGIRIIMAQAVKVEVGTKIAIGGKGTKS